MKKVFEYIGLGVITVFSFYYTDKIVSLTNEKDPIMKEIVKYANDYNTKCVEGYMTSSGVVLGVSGSIVDETASYSNMKGWGFNKDLLVFYEDKCVLNVSNNIDDLIIRGNDFKNSVSIFIDVNNALLLKNIVNISETKKVKINFLVTGSVLEKNKDYFKLLYNSDYDIIYDGNNKDDYKKYSLIMKEFSEDARKYCFDKSSVKEYCYKDSVNTFTSELIFKKDILLNTKNNLNSGNFLVYIENEEVEEELSSVINYIKAKGINIISISNHL